MTDCALKTEKLNLFYGTFQGLKDVNFCVYTPFHNRADRTLGVRQINPAALLQPHE